MKETPFQTPQLFEAIAYAFLSFFVLSNKGSALHLSSLYRIVIDTRSLLLRYGNNLYHTKLFGIFSYYKDEEKKIWLCTFLYVNNI